MTETTFLPMPVRLFHQEVGGIDFRENLHAVQIVLLSCIYLTYCKIGER